MLLMRRSDLMLPAFFVLGACTPTAPVGEDFTLTVTPFLATNQSDIFAGGVDSFEVTAILNDGTRQDLALDGAATGESSRATGLSPMEGARLEVSALREGAIVAWGRSQPFDVATGDDVEVRVLMLAPERGAWLPPLGEGLTGAMLTSVGEGAFLLMGGAANDRNGALTRTRDTIWRIDLNGVDALPSFTEAGLLPAVPTPGGASITRRYGATATPVVAAGPDQGKIVLVGGSDALPWEDSTTVTGAVTLYDPTTNAWEEVPEVRGLTDARSGHLAIGTAQGNVVVWGGWGYTDNARRVAWPSNLEVWLRGAGVADTRNGSTFEDLGSQPVGAIGAAGADDPTTGTLLCGGASFAGTSEDWEPRDACIRLSPDGTSLLEAPELPFVTAGHAMLRLQDGRVLLAGGVHPEGNIAREGTTRASSKAWVLEDGTWTAVGEMSVPRAGHRLVEQADGTVLVVGGSTEWGPWSFPAGTLACVERFEPSGDRFVTLTGCDEGNEAGDLPGRASEPAVASDPAYGTLIVGGTGNAAAAQTGVTLVIPTP